eukprot:CAMPEP_0175648986 /NCGR_PEP_ID=MMETSP0097-20121207/8610_1 /TAXON_ID=311494 /ORGANISM="Alexandrium monilatum, Strain CCMP3105" /LENGTH=114 /DNA_ID=CAMNT_0016954913 /DNA_START=92 /DNA_END=432 /DNA_ORIENTATION=+
MRPGLRVAVVGRARLPDNVHPEARVPTELGIDGAVDAGAAAGSNHRDAVGPRGSLHVHPPVRRAVSHRRESGSDNPGVRSRRRSGVRRVRCRGAGERRAGRAVCCDLDVLRLGA